MRRVPPAAGAARARVLLPALPLASGVVVKDRTGQIFGVLRVLRRGETRGTWVVFCDECQLERVVTTAFLTRTTDPPRGHLACRRERRRQRGLL